jgi:hypothetical protein
MQGVRVMTITSLKSKNMVEIKYAQFGRTDFVNVNKDGAILMIAQFRDVMEDFYRVWPELREENENGLI